MQIQQWEDKSLAHFSYAILSDCEKKIILVDPARDPQPYLDYANQMDAVITGIIETHPHADFVSSHLEWHQRTGATIYVSRLVDAAYPHQGFDEGQSVEIGKIKLSAINTPGHSPDSISILLEHRGQPKAVFTGDTLFIGDCGRPDLREGAGKIQLTRQELARQMYHSLREKLMKLPDEVIVYPAHGAGTLCGKSLSSAQSSTMGAEKMTNWSLQPMSEGEFVEQLLADQPFIPAYFPYDVELNRKGAEDFRTSMERIRTGTIENETDAARLRENTWVVDGRDQRDFKRHHLPHSINLMGETKFETWLGSMLHPGEKFYLAASSKEELQKLMERAAAIGYEDFIEEAFVLKTGSRKDELLDLEHFKTHIDQYTIIDVRNPSELKEGRPFADSISIPLAELRSKVDTIPTDKPLVIHCAGGYRSAAASSLLQSKLNGRARVFDLGEAIKDFNKN